MCKSLTVYGFELREGHRYLIKYWPRHYHRVGRWLRAKYPKYEEVTIKDRRVMSWTGSYTVWSTHTIQLEDIISVSGPISKETPNA